MEKHRQPGQAIQTPVMYLKGVGEHRARLLAKLGVHNVLDLMELFPRTYLSRLVNPTLSELQVGDLVSLTAEISWVDAKPTARGKKILNVGVNDGMIGLTCVWFSYPPAYLKLFKPGTTIWISGTLSAYNNQLQMNHPDFEILYQDHEEEGFWKTRQLLPVYPLTEGLSQNLMRKIVLNAFSTYADQISENLPDFILQKHQFPPRRDALQMMHFAQKTEAADKARIRFAYEEFFYSQIMWARHRVFHDKKEQGITFENHPRLTTALKNKLTFELTSAQKRVIREIFADMCSDTQMSRLVQGDVGSGKTIVTLFAMLLAVENGYQAALMAPTEILAEQHYQNFTKLLESLPIRVVLLKGGNYKGKAELKNQIASGEAQIVLGTHALIQKDVMFHRLGLVVVDEQHRFGVEQRARLASKDSHPDLLYLSATPIPRSLAMTVYGDLQVSQIDEMPPNRKSVLSYVRSDRKFDTVLSDVQKELQKDRQAYFVCPLVEESEKLALLDAQRLFDYLKNKIFTSYTVELIHGRMANKDKDEIMRRFKAGEIQILVSTTVIEVGVDVPNATVMVIEHAERFGLAQLHQLRGRVGRGADQAYCYLISHHPLSSMARERLSIMSRSTDGFVIAEKDLELRGPGEVFGYEQSGLPEFRFANLVQDQAILTLAREDAFGIVLQDPQLMQDEHKLLRNIYLSKYHKREALILY
ncbi:MAG: ATP-dependent DNA helicase RecG [Candidatus Cloacimonadaceae bacterium]|jgi:ATP-dependent DNA helicase RecG|nr:ATP-dependent DNA helicase RecG [Candidatus Cloacimonadota bacterium]MDY0127545.1 ATP-dependent DNA helicase RecG [Candidatus Cloacimonadaceae bacterium]MCB5255265.1 ATP-dependent DNA helicase RecG [Candidatus Cloacimonadota bacterium]MCK9178835.1 ATP-dependent DNA helicase RecG [Candidatus Cloacimonadota bacterium]MCK9242962.1 ATP-dependent DNA helicase RecG [Candidatus Cloacimonadota bacterium]